MCPECVAAVVAGTTSASGLLAFTKSGGVFNRLRALITAFQKFGRLKNVH